MGKNVLYAHAGSGNHGCEAIVRTSVNLIGENTVLYSKNPSQDKKYGIHKVVDEILVDKDSKLKKYSLSWFISRIQTKITGSINNEIYNRKKSMFKNVSNGDVAFSIGGDNYCYPGTDILGAQNYNFRKRGAKTVLWGCSVEPELLKNEEIANDLASYNLIVARESISYEALKQINDNTWLVPDPAFILNHVECELPTKWIPGKMIGINASPLILESSKDGKLVLEAYKELIKYILENTEYSVVLIPHVVWENNDDRIPLKMLYDMFEDTNRIIMLDDHNCMELKGFIRRCRMFIGARTHATIAAYSSGVPTLVLGYSVKSRGIAKDLFGTDENYVLPVQKLENKDGLKDNFVWLMNHEENIREILNKKYEEYIEGYSILPHLLKELRRG